MKPIKIISLILFANIALALIAIGAFFAFVSPNDFKPAIQDWVKENTQRELEIADITLHVYPNIHLNLADVSLSNAQGFSEPTMLAAKNLQLGVQVLPLLSGNLQVERLVLEDLQLNLQKNTQGASNWEDLSQPSTTDTTTEAESQEQSNPITAFAFGGLDIRNANILWDDQSTGQTYTVNNLDIETTAIALDEFFTTQISAANSIAAMQLAQTLALSVEAKVSADQTIALRNLKLNSDIQGTGEQALLKSANLSLISPEIALSPQSISILQTDVTLALQELSNTPVAATTQSLQVTNFNFNLETQTLQAQLQQSGQTQMPSIIGTAIDNQLSLNLMVDLQQQLAKIQQLQLTSLGNQLNADIAVTHLTDAEQLPIAAGQITWKNHALPELFKTLQIELPPTKSDKVLQTADAKLDFSFDSGAQTLTVKQLSAHLDAMTLTGSASANLNPRIQANFDLNLDQLHVSDYLPKSPATDQPEPAPSDEELVIELPKELLRSYDINGQLQVAEFSFDKIQATNTLIKVQSNAGNWKVSPFKTEIFGRTLTAHTGVDVSGETQKFSAKLNAPQMPIGELSELFIEEAPLTGLGTVNADITTAGRTLTELKQNLNGQADANLKDGAVKGFNLAQMIRDAKAKLSGQEATATEEPKQTDFSALIARLNITQGVVDIQELNAQSPYMRVDGSGSVDLVKEQLDNRVLAKIVASAEGQGGKGLSDLRGLSIPVKIIGHWLDPKVSLDMKSVLEEKAKAEIERQKEKLKEQAQQQIEEKKDKVVEDAKKKLEETLKGIKLPF